MAENKGKLLKKYEKLIEKQGEVSEDKFQEIEKELSEDAHETSEGLGIEKEEEEGEEAYPEIKKRLEHDDDPDKEDEED